MSEPKVIGGLEVRSVSRSMRRNLRDEFDIDLIKLAFKLMSMDVEDGLIEFDIDQADIDNILDVCYPEKENQDKLEVLAMTDTFMLFQEILSLTYATEDRAAKK